MWCGDQDTCDGCPASTAWYNSPIIVMALTVWLGPGRFYVGSWGINVGTFGLVDGFRMNWHGILLNAPVINRPGGP